MAHPRRPRPTCPLGKLVGHVALGAQEDQPQHDVPHNIRAREPRTFAKESVTVVQQQGILSVLREGVVEELETLVWMFHAESGHAYVHLHCGRQNRNV